jgi:hypothetical protein
MNEYRVVADLNAVLRRETLLPTVVMWNRLEGRPRTPDFAKALRAEVRDGWWMLARQWQLGEFRGDDAGSPVTAKLSWVTDPITHIRGGTGAVAPLDPDAPLEAVTERQPVPDTIGTRPVSLDVRLLMGRHWAKRLRAAGLSTLEEAFRAAYPIPRPDPADEADHVITAHATTWQRFDAVAGRAVDGLALYRHLVGDAGHLASDGLGLTGTEKDTVDGLGAAYVGWFERMFFQPSPTGGDAWSPPHLEYQVTLGAAAPDGPYVLVADEYHGGRLDWHSFDLTRQDNTTTPFPEPPPPTAPRRTVRSFIPTGARFDGMPATRWWTFEEGNTNLGDIRPDTTDLGKLLLVEFGLVHANDWFLAPLELPVGTVTRVDGLAVTNVFGERLWIEPAARAAGDPWDAWEMFTLTDRDGPAAPVLALLNATPQALPGRPVETVQFVRDEVANLVWGVETAVQLPDGTTVRGREAANDLSRRYREAAGAAPPVGPVGRTGNDAAIRYALMNSIAENWIPFIPVHIPGDNREIQLQRAALPRPPAGRIRPRTVILRPGADAAVPLPYHLYEEEISRAGEVISRSWQRTRSPSGRVYTWLGLQRRTGRGEASSGLAFDRIEPNRA